MRPFEDLLVWQRAHELTLEIYRSTRQYPRDERFGLTSQTRRSASSVPANLAEGGGKRSKPQLRHSVDIAAGSLSELNYWLLLAKDWATCHERCTKPGRRNSTKSVGC